MAQHYVIWSEEHQAWWRPDSAGYTTSLKQAGIYPAQKAKEIVFNANNHGLNEKPKQFCEMAFPIYDPEAFDRIRKLPTHHA